MVDPTTLEQVELRFVDASVPPEYHRSYTIDVTPVSVSVRVDVYGKVIAEDLRACTTEEWADLGRVAATLTGTLEQESTPAVTGDTQYRIRLVGAEQPVEFVWSKRDVDSNALAKQAQELAARVEQLVPRLATLLETEYSE